MASGSRPTRKQAPVPRGNVYAQAGDWLDRLAGLGIHFGRFGRDIAGILLIALAAMSLLALLKLSNGTLLRAWADRLSTWFGWGSYLVAAAVGLGGYSLLRRGEKTLGLGRVLALELAAFCTLALLAFFGGNSVARATQGLDGGYLGWGLARLLTMLFGADAGYFVALVVWVLTLMSGFGLWAVLERKLRRLAGEEIAPGPEEQDGALEEPPHNGEKTSTGQRPAKKTSVPPEFRKSFRVQETQDKRPVEPSVRSERLPPLNILLSEQGVRPDERTINQNAGMIEKTLAEFGIPVRVIGFRVGPTVTQYAVEPGFFEKNGTDEDAQRLKVRVAQIAGLQNDLALALSAERLRIEAPVPGQSFVGIEVPNSRSSLVRLRPILETETFYKVSSPLAIALGRDVSGRPVVADLARMPHILIAGATGSGKSVGITAIATCLAMNNAPEDLRMVLIDSKMVELIRFNGLPHIFGKVETDIQRILGVLRWVVVEMEHRYKLLEAFNARDLAAYNRRLLRRKEGAPLPRIVVIIDELADLMMSAPDQTEHNLVRLAQMARATGIHLVVATQRPSTDVVTGLIKANFPARISYAVASGVDSRVILDSVGAEDLLGRGDMLFLNPEVGNPVRAQGVMIGDQEIERLIMHWQKTTKPLEDAPPWEKMLNDPEDGDDALVEQAVAIVRDSQRASASLLQRRLRIGYPRAARLLDQLEEMGVVGPAQGGGRERDVLVEPEDDDDESR
jgi:S-DNA-T family DNA segregation ATPase FtsK/SpoIIIE